MVKLKNRGVLKNLGTFGLIVGAFVFIMIFFGINGLEDSPICSVFFFMMVIPLLWIYGYAMSKVPRTIEIKRNIVQIKFFLGKKRFKTSDITQINFSEKRNLLTINTHSEKKEIGYLELPPGFNIEEEMTKLIPDEKPAKIGSIKKVGTWQYIDMLKRKFEKKGYSMETIQMEGITFHMIPEYRGRDVLDRYREFFYIFECDGPLTKKEFRRICKITRAYTNSKFRLPWYLRMTQAYTVPIFISEIGFSRDIVDHVTDNRIGKRGGDSVYPVLIDLVKGRLITLENYQVRPGNQLENLPTRKHVEGLRALLSKKGMITPFMNIQDEEKKGKMKVEPKENKSRKVKKKKFRIEGKFKYYHKRWRQPTVLIFVLILPPLLSFFALICFIIGSTESIGFGLGSLLFAGICIGVMWKDLTRKESIDFDHRCIEHKEKRKKRTIIYYSGIEKLIYYKGSERMAFSVLADNDKFIIAHDYYRMEDKKKALEYLLELQEEYGFKVFKADTENDFLYNLKKSYYK